MKKINTIKKIELINIKSLIPYENNARINEAAVPKVASSIKRFGFNVPIVLENDSNVIVCGHTRLKAAIELKAEGYQIDELPCVRVSDLSEEQIKAYRLADNKTAEIAQWDFDKLEKEMAEIGKSIDMEEFGFVDANVQFSGLPPELSGKNLEPEPLAHKGEEAESGSRIIIVFDEERRGELADALGLGEEDIPKDRVIYTIDYIIDAIKAHE